MFTYLQKVIADLAGNPRSHAFINVTSSLSLCIGFLSCTFALILGRTVSEGIVLGLASCLVVLSGHNYRVAKNKEAENSTTAQSEADADNTPRQ